MPQVTRLEPVAPDAWILYWKRAFDFKAGQVVPLALDAVGPTRLYSLATGESDEEAGILFNLVPGGRISPRLGALKPGDRFWVGQPQGSFTAKKGPGVWIGNGTGLAPFLSMAASGLAEGKILIHGARRKQDFYWQEKLQCWPGLQYVRCASQDSGQGLLEGRLTAYLKEREWPADLSFHLCGSAEMVVEARDILVEKGVSFRNIISEVYF